MLFIFNYFFKHFLKYEIYLFILLVIPKYLLKTLVFNYMYPLGETLTKINLITSSNSYVLL